MESVNETKDKEPQAATPTTNNINQGDCETDTKTKSDEKIGVATFIRVIVIRRILVNEMTHTIDKEKYIKNLVTDMKDLGDVIQSKLHKTLSRLTTNDGIKNYFNSWDEQDNNPSIIEMIFNKLILTKFVRQYEEVTTYKSKHNINNCNNSNDNDEHYGYYYQDLVFNMKDLMGVIFSFLIYDYEWKGDLFNCSLVNSHWLYHVYNRPLLKMYHFSKLIENTFSYNAKQDNMNSSGVRMWQRLNKVESIDVYLGGRTPAANELVLNKISVLGNIKSFNGECLPKHVPMLERIIKNCKEKIEWYSLNIDSTKDNVLPFVKLVNAKYISLKCLYFYIVWTNKCETLRLHWIDNITQKLCHFVVNNCDCSNIKSLCLRWVTFLKNDFINNNNNTGKEILEKLAQKFLNLQDLIFDFYDECDDVLLLFVTYLKEIISKNNVKIQYKFDDSYPTNEYRKLIQYIEKNNISNKTHSIMLSFGSIGRFSRIDPIFKAIKSLLTIENSHSNVECITFRNQYSLNTVADLIVNYINPNVISFKSLKVFDYRDDGISETPVQIVTKILQIEFNKLSKRKLFILATFRSEYAYDDKTFDTFFDTVCQRIFNLMIKDKIAIEIKLRLKRIPDESTHDKYYNTIYLSYFNEKRMLKEYKQPQCSEYCTPLNIPKLSFVWDDEHEWSEFAAQNVMRSDALDQRA